MIPECVNCKKLFICTIRDFVELYKSKTTMENKLVDEIAEQLKGGKVE